jgi:hypothetical protein
MTEPQPLTAQDLRAIRFRKERTYRVDTANDSAALDEATRDVSALLDYVEHLERLVARAEADTLAALAARGDR